MRQGYLFIVCLCLLPTVGAAQTSVGFAQPEDVQTLLDYRLPGWSFRTFDGRLALDGREESSRFRGEASSGSQFQGNLGLDYQRTWESEERSLQYGGNWDTRFRHMRNTDDDSESRTSLYDNLLSMDGSYERYLGGGPLSLRGSGTLEHGYSEDHRESTQGENTDELDRYSRTHRLRAALGVGLGRIRNVRLSPPTRSCICRKP